MKKLVGLAILLLSAVAQSQVTSPNGPTYVPGSGGSGSPGGSTGQIQYNNGGSFGGFTLAGDCTFSVPNITCTKIDGLVFPSLVSGEYLTNNGTTLSWATPSSGASTFDQIGSGTNTTATMIVGPGASFAVPGYATASLPTCGSDQTGQIAYTTDGTPAMTFCNGTEWVSSGGTTFTIAGTGCTPTGAEGTAAAGQFTLASGPCTAVTITFNGSVGMPATNGWDCSFNDQTLIAAGTFLPRFGQQSSTTTTATLPIPGASGTSDVITFNCVPY